MRIVFMGTPRFAADILDELARVHEVVAVYTRPDAVRGRGKTLMPSPVKIVAEKLGIPVYEKTSLRDSETVSELEKLTPDAVCVAAYGAILPKEVLDIPRFGCVNVHASLLPKWRGAAPIERAILAGDEEVGVCIMQMEEGLDTGAYCVRRSIPAGRRTKAQLEDELAQLGARALLTALEHIESGNEKWIPQCDEEATYAEKLGKKDLFLNSSDTAETAWRKVAASSDAHHAKCCIAGRNVRITDAKAVDDNAVYAEIPEGSALYKGKKLYIGCSDGVLEVVSCKPDGKREMSAAEFAAGSPSLKEGSTWEGLDD